LLSACLAGVSAPSACGQQGESGAAAASAGGLLRAGLPIRRISFAGVPADRLKPLDQHLEQAVGTALSSDFLQSSLRQLYATGLYDTVEAEGVREGDGVALTFSGKPRMFIGVVSVYGARGATANTQLERASQLTPGTALTDARLKRAIAQMKAALASNGYPNPVIKETLTPHPEQQLTDISFQVNSGAQARVGRVEVTGDAGMSAEEFRRAARLRAGAHVDRDTVNRALDGVLKKYQSQDRLEADVKLVSETYRDGGRTADFRFSANRGPVVRVIVEGAGMERDRVRRLVPIFEEGSVDEDLLNEGNRRLRDYYQRLGYFDVKVSHDQTSPSPEQVNIVYTVELGPRRRVEQVVVTGNRYFDSATLEEMLSVHAATALDRHGAYSQALVSADVNALEALYHNNGFAQVKVTPETNTSEAAANDPPGDAAEPHTVPLAVTYHIDEGPQMRVGAVRLQGNAHMNDGMLLPLLNTMPGQLLSPQNLAGDRDALLTAYMSRGFHQAAVDIRQQPEAANPNIVDVTFEIHEGEQLFVRNVLLTGLHYTRKSTVTPAITVHAGDPLNESALLDTQRNLYTFALFNEVNTAIENPDGAEPYKTVMLQAVEARRWALTYGFGFEAQTGQPQNNCAGAFAAGVKCDPNGKTGVSPRVIADITRNNVFGREQSASLQGTYGLLEQRLQLLYQVPTIENKPNIGLSFSGGYANSQDVTTYVASRLDGGFRLNQSFGTPGSLLSKANTFIYELNFRRVKVAASSLQVYPAEIPELATAVRVSGPSFTWIRDTRDSAMDAHRGTYTSFQEFLSAKPFGAQAEFNRVDTSNSSYYGFDKGRVVLARNTRYGQVRSFGSGFSELIPLPERLYAGGPTSMRGFSQNAAGPRDPETGFPIGGAGALINSTELRLPPPTLPWLGNTVSFVLFEDMGNVFSDASDAWPSALRIHQPDRDACKELTPGTAQNPPEPTGPASSTGRQGACSFNYFSHAPGLGLRYHTPVGPIRFDFSWNLNPPIYPVNINYSIPVTSTNPNGPYSAPYVGQAPHFNFFFSLGQSF
jgi:outer membrane protein insertion porin family